MGALPAPGGLGAPASLRRAVERAERLARDERQRAQLARTRAGRDRSAAEAASGRTRSLLEQSALMHERAARMHESAAALQDLHREHVLQMVTQSTSWTAAGGA